MKIIGVQHDIVWENKQANFDKVLSLLETVEITTGSLIVLPEMFSTGFSMNVEKICESSSNETETFLCETAKRFQSFVLGGLVTQTTDGRGRNESVVADPSGKAIARYCKLHPFTFAGETKHYEPGNRLVTFSWGEFTAAPLICYDLRFPEVFRHAVMRGANLSIVIACWPQSREAHWIALLQARAIENQSYTVGVNRCGSDPKLTYSGRSLILDPRGNVMADAGSGEGVIQAVPDYQALATYRSEFPALTDIRADYRFD